MKDPRDRTNMLVLAIAAAIVLAGGFVMYLVKHNLDMQRCAQERRMDCNSIAIPREAELPRL